MKPKQKSEAEYIADVRRAAVDDYERTRRTLQKLHNVRLRALLLREAKAAHKEAVKADRQAAYEAAVMVVRRNQLRAASEMAEIPGTPNELADMTLDDIGAAEGITRERVRQIERKAKRNLRRAITAHVPELAEHAREPDDDRTPAVFGRAGRYNDGNIWHRPKRKCP